MERTHVSFESDDATCRGDLYLPEEPSPPVVVMAHGFGAERSFRLPAFPEWFADRGLAVLLFDYRGFGDSDGGDQLVDPFRHVDDWLAAVDAARDHPDVDVDRLCLWGTSFSGGHVLETAARRDVDAVVSQVPFVDGLRTVRHLARHSGSGLAYPLVATSHGLRDAARGLLRRPPHTVPVVGPPDEFAMLNTPAPRRATAPSSRRGRTGRTPARRGSRCRSPAIGPSRSPPTSTVWSS